MLWSRPARGAWVEIKYDALICDGAVRSRPARGAWVEITDTANDAGGGASSRPARGAWVEIFSFVLIPVLLMSRPARGAWVEMGTPSIGVRNSLVAPRKGRVG